jgi:phenylacetate-coenzyme A ligase PaaK-like adenylate-forming protein
LNKKIKLNRIHNYYGLVEQTGSIFVESHKCGYLHTSAYSEIYIRDKNFNVLENKKKGLIQLLSLIPTSYPGHNILTEDIGEIIGVDNCKCGLKGKYFLVHGRAKEAEVRGCSDVRG